MTHDFSRFIEAQEQTFNTALAELKAGQKRSHWMWWVFPQIQGLGLSAQSQHFALENLDEAQAYLADPVLGPRLLSCVEAALAHEQKSAREIFGSPDDVKFRSCLTLFNAARPEEPLFERALATFYDAAPDLRTLERLAARSEA